jgi:hypothetical protein
VAYTATTKTFFGTFSGAQIGTTGTVVTGTLDGTANNALRLGNLLPAEPATGNTIPSRTSAGAINATAFNGGPAEKADRLKLAGTSSYFEATTTSVGDTIAARSTAGDITARFFIGTATSAQYADLAEKYLADADYEVGTVVVVGGEKEVTASSEGRRALGVVSENPAYMMNSGLEGGTYIALKGRVPVKVIGAVTKGDRLVASVNGCATSLATSTSSNAADVFAIALKTNLEGGVKFVEAVVL